MVVRACGVLLWKPNLIFQNSYSSVSPSFSSHFSSFMPSSVRIAVVGDVHDDWELEDDSKALQFLQPDLVLFTGDFGNENVELVKSIAELNMPKAAILGNHDSWFTRQFSHNLGEEHVGYKRLDYPTLKLSVVGGRPFSSGGNQLFRKKLLTARYGVRNMGESADRIHKAAKGAPEEQSIVFLAHNGPTGLGSSMDDICGKDWEYGGGDHGDPDLARAISLLKETNNNPIPMVVFGHMHKELAYGGLRKMIAFDADKTMYLNGAIVPRVKYLDSGGSIRAFIIVEFSSGKVMKVAETWVSVINDKILLEEELVLFSSNDETA
ncbi:uncharacterized protein LOC104901810 isoform X2 [Beta vulgaris subsp. vulgaris]|uniref:uncharacterized protein LOC104901810 isoform X2 n=1 Tax=Beta vulgaris subsp. vulgaris TaxID=3555 RepID=UPI00203690B0|nr:uncharacterized protein LOC104901810 isoform X2 [Beta vulgaris subsp. vulgaris]